MTAPVIDPLPSAPSRGSESREQFVLTTDAFLGALGPFVTQANVLAEYLDGLVTGAIAWGDIGGTLADQTDLQAALDAKQDQDDLLDDIAALADPDADMLIFWDDSAGAIAWATLDEQFAFSGTTLSVSFTKAKLDAAVSNGNVCFDGDSVTNLHMSTARILGRTTASTGDVEEITVGTGLDLSAGNLAVSSVLAATTASFTTADETKLDAIEALADVTDETNVVAALSGATLSDVGTPASGDKILLLDASDSDNLKYAAFSEFGGSSSVAIADITDWPAGVDATEVSRLNGVTSDIQTQLNGKQATDAFLDNIAALADPGADRLLGWDESAGAGGEVAFFEAGVGLSTNGASLDVDGWVVLDSDTGVSGVTEVAWTGIPSWVKDLMIIAHGVQMSESNTVSVLLYDGSSWAPASTITTLTSGSDRAVYAEIAGRHSDWGVVRGRAGTAALSSPVVGVYANSQYAFWRCDGGIDGVSVKLGTGDIEAGDFYLYGRA